MPYTFKSVNNLELLEETSKIIDCHVFSENNDIKVQGSMITLFGDPAYQTQDYEVAYCYVIIASREDNEEFYLNVYQGAKGATIAGDNRKEGIYEAAQALKELIKRTEPSDFTYYGYYFDGALQINYGIYEGKVFYNEKRVDKIELTKIYKDINNIRL